MPLLVTECSQAQILRDLKTSLCIFFFSFFFYRETLFIPFNIRINVQNQFAKASLWPVRIIFLLKFLTISDAFLSLLVEINRSRNGIELHTICCILKMFLFLSLNRLALNFFESAAVHQYCSRSLVFEGRFLGGTVTFHRS